MNIAHRIKKITSNGLFHRENVGWLFVAPVNSSDLSIGLSDSSCH